MKNAANTIEDLLEILAGLQGQAKMQIEPSDATIMHSIARQSFKGTALTDRQFALMKEKLQTYRDQFTALDYDFDRAIDALRQPLRHIDRTKYIKLVSHSDMLGPNQVYESYKNNWKWIKIRFPFTKKLIVDLQSIRHKQNEYYHEKGSHEHYFLLNERNVYNIINTFKNKNFEIDQEILNYYNKVKQFEDQKTYNSNITNFKLNNLHPRALELALNDLGQPNADNIIKYKDRAKLYGIDFFDEELNTQLLKTNELTRKIVIREDSTIFVSKKEWTFDNLVSTLTELDRYPLVILINEDNAYNDLSSTHKCFKNIFHHSQISVNFRLSSTNNKGFNEYIKEYQLNSPVDKNTKIVYTSIDKLNKPLLQSECNPTTVLLLESRRVHSKVGWWLNDFDLIIHYDEEMSQFSRIRNKSFVGIA